MEKLKDDIRDCYCCDLYPCSTQDEVSKGDICKDCPVPCCRDVLVALLPCEEGRFEKGSLGSLKMEDNGWCHYYDIRLGICTVYDKRPIVCRVASCRFIREGKIPDYVKTYKKEV